MKKAKKIAFVAMMGLLLFGCGKKKDTTTKPGDTTKTVTTKSTTKEKAKTVVLVYSVGEGSIPGGSLGKEIEYGKDFTLDVPVWTGHTFNGWYVLEKTINKVMLTDGKGKSLKPFDLDSSSETITIIADYVPEVDTVTFDTCGGSNINSQQVAYDSYATEPTEEPTKEGHSFNGWYTAAEGGKEWDFEKNLIHGDTTIYAQWCVDRYDYYFKNGNSDAGTISCNLSSLQNKADYGTEVILKVEEASGWSFIGWYDTDAEKFVSDELEYKFTIPAHSICYEAMFDSFDLTTEVYGNGSCTVYDGSSITAGTKVELEATPATGHHFVGWFIGESLISDKASYEYTMPKESVTITAKFEYDEYSLKVTVNKSTYGSIAISPEKDIYHYGDEVTLTATTEDGYSFVGWFDGDELLNSSKIYTHEIVGNANIDAIFTYYELTIAKDGGQLKINNTLSDGISKQKTENGTLINVQAINDSNHEFLGWFVDDNTTPYCLETIMTIEMPENSVTFTAKWATKKYDVTINNVDSQSLDDLDDEVGSYIINNGPYEFGTFVTDIAIDAETENLKYSFVGWYSDASCTDLITTSTTLEGFYIDTINVFYAKWAPKEYSVKFVSGDSSINGSNQGKTYYYIDGVSAGSFDHNTSIITKSIKYNSELKFEFAPYTGRQIKEIRYYVGSECVDLISVDSTATSKIIIFTYTNTTSEDAYIKIMYEAVEEMQYFTFMAGKIAYDTTNYNCRITGANPEYVNASGYVNVTELTVPTYVDGIDQGALAKFTMLQKLTLPFIGETGAGSEKDSYSQKYVFSYIFGSTSLYNTVASEYVYNVEYNHKATAYLPKDLAVVKITNKDIIPCCAFAFNSGCPTNFKVVEVYPTAVGDYAFYGSNIAGNYVPSDGKYVYSVGLYTTYVGKYAFANDTALTCFWYSLTGDPIEDIKKITIGKCAFAGCKNLNYLHIPFVGESANFDTSSTTFNIKYSFFYWFGESSDSKVQNKSDMYAWTAFDNNVYYVPKTIGSAKFSIDFVSFCGIAYAAFAYNGTDTAGSTSAPLFELHIENAAYDGTTNPCYKIGNNAFYKVPRVRFYEYNGNAQLRCVSVFGANAFRNAGLQNSPFSSNYSHDVVTIEQYAFFNAFSTVTSGVYVVLPDEVSVIEYAAFAGSLNKINGFVFNKGIASVASIFKTDDTTCATVSGVYFNGSQTDYSESALKSTVVTWNIGFNAIYKYSPSALDPYTTTVIASF